MKIIFNPQVLANENTIGVSMSGLPCNVDACGYYCIGKCGTLQHNCSRGIVGYSEQGISNNK